jgi:hypothetical protein
MPDTYRIREKGTMSEETLLWQADQFPILYEHGQPKAVVVDLQTFKRLELILDNLLNREPGPEDALVAESAELKQLIAQVQAVATPMPDWKQVIDEL